ncbi:unnamed protein product [Aphanomyces euteiches]
MYRKVRRIISLFKVFSKRVCVPSPEIISRSSYVQVISDVDDDSMSKPKPKPLQAWAEQMIMTYQLTPLEEDEYFVQWETGRLGVNISEDKETELPFVSKITDATSPLAAAMEVGDFLLCVNELRAEENTFNNFLRLLTTKQKPVLLRFRRATMANRTRILMSQEAKIQETKALDARSQQPQRKQSKEEAKPTLRPTSSSDGGNSRNKPRPMPVDTSASQMEEELLTPPLPDRRKASPAQNDKPPVRRTSPPMSYDNVPNPRSPVPNSFVFSWVDGPLGVYFGEDEMTQLPVVTRTLPHASPLITSNVKIGDVLISANGLLSSEHPFSDFFAALQKMSKPIALVFVPPPSSSPPPVQKNQPAPQTSPVSHHPAPLNRQTSPHAHHNTPQPPQTPPLARQMSPHAATPQPPQTPPFARQMSPHANAQQQPQTPPLAHQPSPQPHLSAPLQRQPSPQQLQTSPRQYQAPPRQPQTPPLPGAATPLVRQTTPQQHQTSAQQNTQHTRQSTPPQPSTPPHQPQPPSKASFHPETGPSVVHTKSPDTDTDSDDEDARQMYNNLEQLDDEDNGKVKEAVISKTDDPVTVPDELPFTPTEDESKTSEEEEEEDESAVITDADLDLDLEEPSEESDEALMPKLEFPPRTHSRRSDDKDKPSTTSNSSSSSSSSAPLRSSGSSSSSNERLGGRRRSGGKKRNGSAPISRLPKLNELEEQTIPLVEPNSVNMKLTVRGRLKSQRTSKSDTPDSSLYLVKWKENKSIGVQLRECRLAKGVYPMVVLVCREPCCESLRHVNIGDLLLEINGRDTAMMGVKKTIAFVKTCTKTALLKFKRGPGISVTRVSA